MELLQLKYFQVVARLEHMTKAGEELRIPQPAISKTISNLESELNVKLFDRIGKYIRLNECGRIFLKKVNTAISALEEGKRELQDVAGNMSGSIELSVLAGSHLLPDLLASFHERFPHVQFHLLQHATSAPAQSHFDLCIYSNPLNMFGMESITLLKEDIYLAVPINHHLANRSHVKLSELADEGFVSLRPGKSLRETMDAFCRQAGFTPRIIYESDDPAMVRGLIRAGQGIAFIPAITWGGSTGASVTLVSIEAPRCERTIHLSWPKDKYFTQSAAQFREYTIDYFSNLNR